MDSVQFLAPSPEQFRPSQRLCVCMQASLLRVLLRGWERRQKTSGVTFVTYLQPPRKSYSRLLAGEGWGGQVAKPQLSSRVETCM